MPNNIAPYPSHLYGVSWDGQEWIAVGCLGVSNLRDPGSRHALVLTSLDGIHWASVTLPRILQNNNSFLYDAAGNGHTRAIIGQVSTNNDYTAVILTSTYNDVTRTWSDWVLHPLPSMLKKNSVLGSIHWNQSLKQWITAGQYWNNSLNHYQSLIITSSDASHWVMQNIPRKLINEGSSLGAAF